MKYLSSIDPRLIDKMSSNKKEVKIKILELFFREETALIRELLPKLSDKRTEKKNFYSYDRRSEKYDSNRLKNHRRFSGGKFFSMKPDRLILLRLYKSILIRSWERAGTRIIRHFKFASLEDDSNERHALRTSLIAANFREKH